MDKDLELKLSRIGVTETSLQKIQASMPEQDLNDIIHRIITESALKDYCNRGKNYGNHGCTILDEDTHPDPARRARLKYERLREENKALVKMLLSQFPYIQFY